MGNGYERIEMRFTRVKCRDERGAKECAIQREIGSIETMNPSLQGPSLARDASYNAMSILDEAGRTRPS